MLPIAKIAMAYTLTDLFKSPSTALSHDFAGRECESRVKFWLAMNDSALFFGAEVGYAPWQFDCARQGEFYEGLWERDLAELFLCSESDIAYQEFNLSPAGAWWTCPFSAPRCRDLDKTFCRSDVETFSEISEHSWRAAIKVPLANLLVNIAPSRGSRANVTVILGSEPRKYLSWCKLPGSEANFHQPDCFQSLKS